MKKTRREVMLNMAKKVFGSDGLVSKVKSVKVRPMLRRLLSRKPLHEDIRAEEKQDRLKSPKDMSDAEILDAARKVIADRGIVGTKELVSSDPALFGALMKPGLLDDLGSEKKQMSWAEMTDDELVQSAERFIKENGITKRSELKEADYGLFVVLLKRKLLDHVGLEKNQVSWAKVHDAELVQAATAVISENNIASLSQLRSHDTGLYTILRKRNLLDQVKLVKSD